MNYQSDIDDAVSLLHSARDQIRNEMRDYPTPISGCDAQYNHLIGLQNAVGAALNALAAPSFVATPRTPSPNAGIESR